MHKTVSARIPKDVHEELRNRCNNIGCNINEFIEHAIEFALYSSTDFDFGDEEESQETAQLTNVRVTN